MGAALLGVFLLGLFMLTRFVIWGGLLQIEIQRTQRISERILHRLNDDPGFGKTLALCLTLPKSETAPFP